MQNSEPMLQVATETPTNTGIEARHLISCLGTLIMSFLLAYGTRKLWGPQIIGDAPPDVIEDENRRSQW